MDIFLSDHPDLGPLPVEALDEAGYISLLAETESLRNSDVAPLDVVIHGLRARLHTDNPHWRQLWSLNWFAPDQWASLTGNRSPVKAQITVYAGNKKARGRPWAGYSHAHHTAFLMGNTPYGSLQALVCTAVARLLAENQAAHYIPGICIKRNGKSTLVLSFDELTTTELAIVVSNLMKIPDMHLVALRGVVVRYGLVRMVDGVTLLPVSVIGEKGHNIVGYRLFSWLDEHGYWEPRADARCLTLTGDEEYCFARDLDLGRAPEAFAYSVEQAWYVPTQIVATAPELVGILWKHGKLENVLPGDAEGVNQFREWAREAIPSGDVGEDASIWTGLAGWDEARVIETLCRLRASPNGRVMIAPQHLWPNRVSGNPARPVQIEQLQWLDEGSVVPRPATDLSGKLVETGSRLYGTGGEDIGRTLTTMLERATFEKG
jgi:hypothetical protein